MNTKKVGMYIMAPLFAFAVGHTVINKVKMDKEIANTQIVNSDNISKVQSNAISAEFKAKNNIQTDLDTINKLLDERFNDYDKDVKTLNNIAKEIANHENYVECGD